MQNKIEINGKIITVREPKVRDMMAIDKIKNDAEKEMALCSNLTGLTSDEIMEMKFKDYNKIQEVIVTFL